VAARSKVCVFACSLAGTAGSNPAGGMSVVGVACCKVEVSDNGRSFAQRSLTEYGVTQSDSGTSTMRRPGPTGLAEPWEEKITQPRTRVDRQTLA